MSDTTAAPPRPRARASGRASAGSGCATSRPSRGSAIVDRDRGLGADRLVQRAVGPALGDRPGRPLLLAGDARRPVPPLGLERPDRLRLLAGVPPARLAAHGRCHGRRSWRSGRRSCIAAVRFLTGPRLLAAGLLFPFTAMEVAGGNVSLLLAVGDRHRVPLAGGLGARPPDEDHARDRAAVVRGPARVASLAIALGATAAIVAVSFVLLPRAVARLGRRRRSGTPARAGRGRASRSRSGSACRSRSPSSSGAPGRTGAGRCRWRRCSPCRRSGTAASRCCSPRSRSCPSRAASGGCRLAHAPDAEDRRPTPRSGTPTRPGRTARPGRSPARRSRRRSGR